MSLCPGDKIKCNMSKSSEIIIFDPFSGASGDMVIGSLLSLGANSQLVKDVMESVADVSVSIFQTTRAHIHATRIEVKEVNNPHPQLTYNRMVDIICCAGLPGVVEDDALGILEILGRSESEVHNTSLDELHLHEIGQQDAIADIVGAVTAFHSLELTDPQLYCMQVFVGGGYVHSAHGRLPVPAPATLNILNSSGLIWRGGPGEHELLTPTGAAILAYLTQRYGTSCTLYPQIRSISTGYGAGAKELDVPNVLRTVVGEATDLLITDYIEMLETNVDDVTGEVLGFLIHELLDEGALDVSVIPATMKKGRSGHLIKVICRAADSNRLAYRIMAETGSLGVRMVPVKHRLTANRKMMSVDIPVAGVTHCVRVKVASDNHGNILNISAEFDDCAKIARKTGHRVKNIMHSAQEAARKQMN